MRDIKTREKYTGTIKTIDRASMLSHRMKQASIKAKDQAKNYSQDNEHNEVSYAEENTLSIAEGAVVTTEQIVRVGRDSVIKSAKTSQNRNEIARMARDNYQFGILDTEETAVFSKKNSEIIANKAINITKTVINEPAVIYTESKVTGSVFPRVTMKPIGRQSVEPISYAPTISKDKAETILKRQFQEKKAKESLRRRTERSGKKILASLKRSLTKSKLIYTGLAVTGCIAMISIIVCTFFGSAFYILGDESNSDFITGEFDGVGNTAIVEVAAAQVGNVGGGPYWSWYGFYDRVEWCACFVSWCANKCGYIDDGIIPKFAVVGHGMSWFQNRGRWQNRGYHPKPGDIIFFDWDGDGLGNHVGIVENSDDTYVYTIEGNSGDRCRRRTYFITSSMIMGYGIPAYPTEELSEKEE